MAFIKLVPTKKILPLAFELIKKSKKTLHLTMMLNEESKTISDEYVKLIKKKIFEGVIIKRIGFGKKENYKKAQKIFGVDKRKKNYIFKYCSNFRLAQRLLIADEKKMLFAVYKNKKDKFVFYTKYKQVINGFIQYFNEIFDKI